MNSDVVPRVVFVSAFQDYRTKKRASIQQVAEGVRDIGCDVWFVSTRYSLLSKFTGDSRAFLNPQSNKVEDVNGVHCYLWKTLLHPFSAQNRLLNWLMGRLFYPYSAWPSRQFDSIIRGADYVVVESSVAVIYLQRIRKLAPHAKIIYYATDLLDTVGAHPSVQKALINSADLIHHVCLRSSQMVPSFPWAKGRLYKASFGMRSGDFGSVGTTPYGARKVVVSIGSMLFDRSYFEIVPRFFEDIVFHVIGCGQTFEAPSNVIIHGEMPFIETLPYIKYAAAGVAPYRQASGVEYLAESSLKLAQYEVFGLPAICPKFAVGTAKGRFGYDAGSASSMIAATKQALSQTGLLEGRSFPTWEEVARELLFAETFPETRIG